MNIRHYSYLLIKPDGIKYLKEIEDIVDSKKFDRVIYFAVDDWEKVQKDLYEQHYKKESFAKSYQVFVDSEKILYGNKAIVILVSRENEKYEELIDLVYQTKLEIREKLAYQVGIVGIKEAESDEKSNKIFISEGESIKKEIKRFNQEGKKYTICHLDVIHSPDPEKQVTLRELEKLYNLGIISDKNIISEKLLEYMEKYKTAEFIQDQEKNQLQTCDYSGKIAQEIGKDR